MRKRMFWSLLAVAFTAVISFIVWDSFLWRSFGFRFCEKPEFLSADTTVKDDCCNIILADNSYGSFSSATYNGVIHEFENGVLKIGTHKSRALNASSEIVEEITVNGTITEVRLCGNGSEKIVWSHSGDGSVIDGRTE